MYLIEKNIPIKKETVSHTYPLASMEVGDSFLVPYAMMDPHVLRVILSRLYKQFPDKKFITRCVSDGTRCWRTK